MSEKQPTRLKYSENEVKLMRAKDKARIAELEKALADIIAQEDYLDIEPFEPVYDVWQRAKKVLG